MDYTFDLTDEIQAAGAVDPTSRTYDLHFRLTSNRHIAPGDAWGISWNQVRLKYPTFRKAKLVSVALDGAPETWGTCYAVTAHYELAEKDEEDPLFATLHFSTKGGREKRIHSFATRAWSAAKSKIKPPNFQHGVNYNNGVYEGADVVVPAFGFSLDVDVPATVIPPSQLLFFHGLTGKVNGAPIWIFGPGEVLFLGVNGDSYRKQNALTGVWESWFRISFEFEAAPSLVNVDLPPFADVTKRGMEYLWVFHQEEKDEESGVTIPVPAACYVEQMYPFGDFEWFKNIKW